MSEKQASKRHFHAGGHFYERHTVGWNTAHSSPQDLVCFTSDTYTAQTLTLTLAHTLLLTAFKAKRRSLSDSLVLLMSRAHFKQGHLCRTSQAEEKSQLRSIMRTSFNFLFLPQRSQHVLQIITRQQTGFLNKYPRCISLILNSQAVCDAFLPHSHNANQIVV